MRISVHLSRGQFAHLVQAPLSWLEKLVPHLHFRNGRSQDSVGLLAARRQAGTHDVVEALADSTLACALLTQAIPEAGTGKWRLLSFRIRNIQHHHRKRIIKGQIYFRRADEPLVETEDIVIKVYGSDRGGRALQTLKQLWRTGFRSPAKNRVPQPYGYLPNEGALLQATAPGTSLGDLVRTDDSSLESAAARAAAWLVELQGSPLDGECRDLAGEAESAQRWGRELAGIFPNHADRLQSLCGRMLPALQSDRVPLAPSHGDYHPMNIFLTPSVTTVIDFDTFALREAAFDVGYAIGQLLIMSYFQAGGFEPGAAAAMAFWNHYQLTGTAPWDRVAVQIARTFLQSLHYELHTLRNNRIELLDLWTNQMEAWLESSRTTLRDGLRAIPARVQLAGVR